MSLKTILSELRFVVTGTGRPNRAFGKNKTKPLSSIVLNAFESLSEELASMRDRIYDLETNRKNRELKNNRIIQIERDLKDLEREVKLLQRKLKN